MIFSGEITAKGGHKTNILELLGIEVSPIDVKIENRSGSIDVIEIDGAQYALSDVLTAFAGKLSAISLSTLPDVNIEEPADGDILVYDGEYWENVPSEPSTPDETPPGDENPPIG